MIQTNAALLQTPVTGVNLTGETLADQLTSRTLLVFLRHFGCIFCRETVADIQRAADADPNYPDVLFFYQGTPERGAEFMRALWPEARAVADSPKRFYEGFNVPSGGMNEMFGAEVWACGVRAAAKGHFVGMKEGDPWTLPTLILLQGGAEVWRYEGRHAGDHPDFSSIPQHA